MAILLNGILQLVASSVEVGSSSSSDKFIPQKLSTFELSVCTCGVEDQVCQLKNSYLQLKTGWLE